LVTLELNAAVPTAPTGFEASDATTPFEIGLSWEHVRGAELYRVFRGTSNDLSSATSIGITESITFKDSTGPGERYFYWVRAEGSSGTSSPAGPEQGSTSNGFSPFHPSSPLAGILVTSSVVAPTGSPITAARVYLGKTMFWDEQLSSTRTVACGTCHVFRAGGTDPRAGKGVAQSTNPGLDGVAGTADDAAGSMGVPSTRADGAYLWSPLFGLNPQVTPRRAGSILDTGFATQGVLWDGKPGFVFNDPVTNKTIFSVNASLEAQALLPLLNTTEMAHEGRTIAEVVTRIAESRPLALSPSVPTALARWIDGRTYSQLFEEAFGTPEITPARIAMGLSSYERTLVADRTGLDGVPSPATISNGIVAFGAGRCSFCHRPPLTSDEQFHVTGLRPAAEDQGRGAISKQPFDMASFRTPSLRNAGLRNGFQHTGMLASLEEVVEFYNRGGDFTDSVGFVSGVISPLNLTAQQKADLVSFLRTATIDKRVERESAPLFDRPLLYSESARVPVLLGANDPAKPQAIALEPPFAGNPRFTVGVSNIAPGSRVALVIDRTDPGESPSVTTVPPFFRGEGTASDGGAGHGFASLNLPIPAETASIGTTLFGRWYVTTNGTVTSSQAFRFTIFAAGPGTEDFTGLSAAGLTKGVVARESIVSGFGSGLASSTVVAPSGALPTTLGGLRVSITDRAGGVSDAPLYFVSAGQINYVVPASVAEGEASVRVLRGESVIARGTLQVASVAPALFAANSDGRDTAAALVQQSTRLGAGGVFSPVRFDTAQQRFVPVPIDLGTDSDQTFLLLFGTGIRSRPEGSVSATIGGTAVEVLYAGPQGEFAGMDQVNLRLPRDLAGRGELDVILTVDGRRANHLRIAVK
jgi:uncharacterized protein (TIGR03437 family)